MEPDGHHSKQDLEIQQKLPFLSENSLLRTQSRVHRKLWSTPHEINRASRLFVRLHQFGLRTHCRVQRISDALFRALPLHLRLPNEETVFQAVLTNLIQRGGRNSFEGCARRYGLILIFSGSPKPTSFPLVVPALPAFVAQADGGRIDPNLNSQRKLIPKVPDRAAWNYWSGHHRRGMTVNQ